MIQEFVEGFEKFLLIGSIEFSERRGVVCSTFLFYQTGTDFSLAVIGRFVALLLIMSTK